MNPDTIRRLIANQKAEHFPHAFRAGAAGMADFNQLFPMLSRLPAAEHPDGAWWMEHRGLACVPKSGAREEQGTAQAD